MSNCFRFRAGLHAVDWQRVHWYFTVPMLLSGLMITMFFSGIPLLESIVAAPYLDSVPMNSRREFGLLENLQHLMLLGAVALALRTRRLQRETGRRFLTALLALGLFVLFLEEIDYGLHYYEYLAGIPHEEVAEVRNIHNTYIRTSTIKRVSDLGMILLFGVAPFALARTRHPAIRFWTPDRMMWLFLVAGWLTRTLARHLHGIGLGHGLGLDSNLSEFRELVTYYAALAYIALLYRRARSDTTPTPIQRRPLTKEPRSFGLSDRPGPALLASARGSGEEARFVDEAG